MLNENSVDLMMIEDPVCSTDSVWRETDMDRSLTSDLATIEANIAALQTGKSDTSHTHTGYAAESHVHEATPVAVTGENLNDYINPGIWSFPQANVPTNVPAGTNGWLIVMPWGDGTGTVKQIWLRHGTLGETDHEIYTRTRIAGLNAWSSWTKIITSKDIENTGAPLWQNGSDGGYYMVASQTVTPSKALSECRNGWVLVWSDYDPSTSTTNNSDICTTVIPKRNPFGELWSGHAFLCVVPTYMNESTGTDTIHIKKVYVHNDRLVGFAGNALEDRRDVVLRAVYEY